MGTREFDISYPFYTFSYHRQKCGRMDSRKIQEALDLGGNLWVSSKVRKYCDYRMIRPKLKVNKFFSLQCFDMYTYRQHDCLS